MVARKRSIAKESEAKYLQRAPRRDRTELRDAPAVAELKDRIRTNLRRVRLERGWSQEQAANAADVSLRVYQLIEAGRTNVTLVSLVALATAFEIDVVDLIART